MHLELAVPNIWYRAELNYGSVRLAGLTFPGLPMLLTGSNGKVAWGFTNSKADVVDLVSLAQAPSFPDAYRVAGGERRFETRLETIAVRGRENVSFDVKQTIWGPVAAQKLLGQDVAIHWTLLDPSATNLDILDMDRVSSVAEGVELFHRVGGAPLNVLLADARGDIAWTMTGRLPKRIGVTGLYSVSWADDDLGWRGYLAPEDIPTIVNPPSGLLINTNNKMLSDKEFPLGVGHEYQGGVRAWLALRRLSRPDPLSESDLGELQLDTSSDYYRYYRDLALRVLGDDQDEEIVAIRRYIEAWDGRANSDSLGLPLIQEFVFALKDSVLAPIAARCREFDPEFELNLTLLDDPVKRMIETDRVELLPDRRAYADWKTFLRAVLKKTARNLMESEGVKDLKRLTWGQANKVEISHPLASAAPFLGWLLNMPRTSLPGCAQCLRVSSENTGANARMVVSPGHEPDGLMQFLGGQSGQPGSPNFSDQQGDWASGRFSSFLSRGESSRMTLLPLH